MDLGPGPAGILQLKEMVQRFINLSVEVSFVILTIMLIVGGIKYLTSGGDSKAIGSAGGTITWALLGILFMALAWIILLILKGFTGVDLTNFCFGFPGSRAGTSCF